MIIHYDDSPAGDGKTTRAIASIVANSTSKTVFCVERRETFSELRAMISAECSKQDVTLPRIIEIKSGDNADYIQKQLDDALDEVHSRISNQHIVMIITHSALTKNDLSCFHGWNLFIDEVPPFFTSDEYTTNISSAVLANYFALSPSQLSEWAELELTELGQATSTNAFNQDTAFKQFAQLHQQVCFADGRKTKVLTNLTDWSLSTAKTKWAWASMFSVRDLEMFESVTFLANAVTSSVIIELSRAIDPSVEWQPLPRNISNSKPNARNVTIRYFSEHDASINMLTGPKADKRILENVSTYLAKALPANAIWSANAAAMPVMSAHLQKQQQLTPRQAGSNAHLASHDAALIFAALPSPNIATLLRAYDIDASHWQRTFEHETILQFVTRTSIRVKDSTAPVNFYVFDRADADYLNSYFCAQGHSVNVEFVDVSINTKPSKRGPKAAAITPQEQAEKLAERKAYLAEWKRQDRAKKKAEKQLPQNQRKDDKRISL